MMQYSFNSGWKFLRGVQNSEVINPKFDDSPWEAVTLGHTVRLEPVNVSGGLNYQGDAWYRKRFILDDTFKGKKLYIKFEAAMHEAEVYLNGIEIKRNFCGYLPFVVDITDKVLFNEENVMVVRVNNEDNADIPPGKPQQELGILVITPIPGWQFYPEENHCIFDKRVEDNVRRMVRYMRNHASIAFWEPIINEEGKTPDEFRRMTYCAVHEEYPGEQCYCAIDEEYDTENLYDIIYKKTMKKNPHRPGFTREYGDTWKEQTDGYEPKHCRVNREENAFGGFYPGGKRAMIDNMLARTAARNIDGKNIDGPRFLNQKYQSNKSGLDTGFCLWAGFDHNRGCCLNPACVGAIDFYRLPKYQYYSYQAQSKDVDRMVFIAEDEDRVWCVSNCEKVRLYRDGVFIGERSTAEDANLPSVPVEFSLDKAWSELRAEGYDGGKLEALQIKKRAEAPRKIVLTAKHSGVRHIRIKIKSVSKGTAGFYMFELY